MAALSLGQAVESALTENRQDPSLGDQNAGFHFCLVAGSIGARGQHSAAVMLGQIGIGGIQLRLVEAGFVDAALKIIRDQTAGRTLKILKGMYMRADPVRQGLRQGGLGVGIVRGSPNSDKELGSNNFSGQKVNE